MMDGEDEEPIVIPSSTTEETVKKAMRFLTILEFSVFLVFIPILLFQPSMILVMLGVFPLFIVIIVFVMFFVYPLIKQSSLESSKKYFIEMYSDRFISRREDPWLIIPSKLTEIRYDSIISIESFPLTYVQFYLGVRKFFYNSNHFHNGTNFDNLYKVTFTNTINQNSPEEKEFEDYIILPTFRT